MGIHLLKLNCQCHYYKKLEQSEIVKTKIRNGELIR